MKSDAEIDELLKMHLDGWSIAYAAKLLGWSTKDFYIMRRKNYRIRIASERQRESSILKSRLDVDSVPFPKKKKVKENIQPKTTHDDETIHAVWLPIGVK